MCLGGGGGGQSEQIAQQQLALAQKQEKDLEDANNEKKANILYGQASIDKAFAQFNPAYYNKYQTSYAKAQTVPLAQQYNLAKDSATAALTGRGIGSSSVGNQVFADLNQRDATEAGKISNEASNAVNSQRSNIENAKTNLYGVNSAGNDPTAISASAIGQASALVNPPQSAPLGNVFADLLTPLGNYFRAGQTTPNASIAGVPTAIGVN